MGQGLYGSAKTTPAIRAAIQRPQASIKELSERYDLNPKTVMKWKKREKEAQAAQQPAAPETPAATPVPVPAGQEIPHGTPQGTQPGQ